MINCVVSILSRNSSPRRRIGAWFFAAAIIVSLGLLRTATDAEYTFASAAIVPVLAVAWVGGRNDGYFLSLLAAVVWISADIRSERQFSAAWIPFANGFTQLVTYSLVSYLIDHMKVLLVREKELSTHGDLTKLLNRRAFFELGDAEVNRSKRYDHSIAVAFLDLDDFKQLNDICGHEIGDCALRAVAIALQNTLRSTDNVTRLGGDEFSVLLPEVDFEAAKEAGYKIAHAVNAAVEKFPPVSVSVGVSWFEVAEGSFASMLATADALMYEIKREGKHGIRIQRAASRSR